MKNIFIAGLIVFFCFGSFTASDSSYRNKATMLIDLYVPGQVPTVIGVPFSYKNDTFGTAVAEIRKKLQLSPQDEVELEFVERGTWLKRPVDLNSKWDPLANKGLPPVRATVKKVNNVSKNELILGNSPWMKL